MAIIPRTVALIANGFICNYNTIQDKIKTYEKIIAIDGGLRHCRKMALTPDLLVGDLDSVSQEHLDEYPLMEIKKFPRLKDETDLELGVKIANTPGTRKITIFAALGDRTDHSLANLYLLLQYPSFTYIETEVEVIFSIQKLMNVSCFPGQTISLIPLGQPVSGVTTKGLQWELQNANFSQTFMSVSNVCLSSSFDVEVKNGSLLCCMQK